MRPIGPWLRLCVSLALLALFVLALNWESSARIVAHVLAVLGAGAAALHGRKAWSGEDRRLFAGVLSFVLASVLSFAVHPTRYGASRLGFHAMMLLALPIAAGLRAVRPGPAWLWWGTSTGALASVAWAVVDAAKSRAAGADATYARAGTGYHTVYGAGIAAFAFLALGGAWWFASRERRWAAVPLSAFVAALVGAVLSSSRGAWAGIGLACFVLLAGAWRGLAGRHRVVIIGGGLAFALLVATVPQLGVAARVAAVASDLRSWSERSAGHSSLGGRFAAWRVAWGAFKEHPLVGIGVGNYKAEAQRVLAGGIEETYAAGFDHPHSEFVAALGTRGIAGLLALVAMLGLAMARFWRAARDADPMRRGYGVAGLGAIVALSTWGLTDSLFERELPAILVVVSVGVMHGMIRARDDELAETA